MKHTFNVEHVDHIVHRVSINYVLLALVELKKRKVAYVQTIVKRSVLGKIQVVDRLHQHLDSRLREAFTCYLRVFSNVLRQNARSSIGILEYMNAEPQLPDVVFTLIRPIVLCNRPANPAPTARGLYRVGVMQEL